jgi:hypothetical protein
MPLTSAQLMAQVLVDVQDDGTIAEILELLWTKNDSRTLWMQYLYTKLDAVNILIARATGLISYSGDGRSMQLNQKFDHLITLRNVIIGEIASFDTNSFEPSVDEMTQTSPIMGNPGYPDPNSGLFTGDPTSVQLYPYYGYRTP